MYLLGWGTVTRDPDYGMYELISTSTMGAAGNRSFYSNPTVDKLLEEGRTEPTPRATDGRITLLNPSKPPDGNIPNLQRIIKLA